MRLLLPLTLASLTLAGCVYGPPPATVNPVPMPQPTDQVTATMKLAATQVVNREMAKRLPGVNVAPYTSCVIQNANMAEIADLASMAAGEDARAAGAVASIVQRPATTQCIASAARMA